MASGGVHKLINLGEWETIFGTCLIEVFEVHAHSPLPTVLLDQYNVGEPLRVLDFSDEPRLEEFLYLLFGGQVSFSAKLLFFCLTGLKAGSALNLCTITSGLSPFMSAWDQAKISALALKH